MFSPPTLAELAPAIPELVLAIGVLLLILVGLFAGERATRLVTGLAVALIAVAAGILIILPISGTLFESAFVVDPFARFMKIAVLIGSGIAIAMSVAYARKERFDRFEYPVLIVTSTLGMLMMISAHDLMAVYLGLELQSLGLYVVAAINRDSTRSTEAGLKYFVLGALSSGMLLYGMSLVYGFVGQTSFTAIAAAVEGGAATGVVFGLVFMLVGLAFKIGAVPFHMWTPDVYEGAPTPVTAFFTAAPKIAAMALFVRVVSEPFLPMADQWQQVITFIAIASMLLGAFAGIGQRNIKRLMAYSSIGHVGYALVGLASGTQQGVQGVVVYMTIYLATVVGVFACILAMRRRDGAFEEIDRLAGLSRTNPAMAFILAMLLFSLAGIPPLAGFFAKFYVFLAAIEAGLYALSVIGVLASVVGAFYYLRIVKLMYFDEPAGGLDPMPGELRVVLGASGVFTLAFVLFAGPLGEAADVAAGTFFAAVR